MLSLSSRAILWRTLTAITFTLVLTPSNLFGQPGYMWLHVVRRETNAKGVSLRRPALGVIFTTTRPGSISLPTDANGFTRLRLDPSVTADSLTPLALDESSLRQGWVIVSDRDYAVVPKFNTHLEIEVAKRAVRTKPTTVHNVLNNPRVLRAILERILESLAPPAGGGSEDSYAIALKREADRFGLTYEEALQGIKQLSRTAQDPYTKALIALSERDNKKALEDAKRSRNINLALLQKARNEKRAANASIRESKYNTVRADMIIGQSCFNQADYQQSVNAYREALSLAAGDPNIMNDLSASLVALAEYPEAERLLNDALATKTRMRGIADPSVANTFNNLGEIYLNLARYGDAEEAFTRAIKIWQDKLGPDDPNVANGFNNLARLFVVQGKNDKAEKMYIQARTIRERKFGPDHLDVAQSLSNLGGLYIYWRPQGVTVPETDPKSLIERSLKIRQTRHHGKDHPDIADSLNNLANVYFVRGDLLNAEENFRKALGIWEWTLGKDHPLLAFPLLGLSKVYQQQRKYKDEEDAISRALAIRKKAFGEDHPLVADCLNEQARRLAAKEHPTNEDYAGAERLYTESLTIRQRKLGNNHPDVAASLINLGALYIDAARYFETIGRHPLVEGEALTNKGLIVFEQTYGSESIKLLPPINNLGEVYMTESESLPDDLARKKLSDAEEKFKRCLSILDSYPNPPLRTYIQENLAKVMAQRKKRRLE